jgi:excisionase family DNA binding protein
MPSRKSHPDDLLTVADAAQLLRLSVDMVRHLENAGRLPALRTVKGMRLFKRVDVEALAAQRREQAASKKRAREVSRAS